jgi:hypothetical protein
MSALTGRMPGIASGLALFAIFLWASPAHAVGKEARVAVVIGNNLGLEHEKPLQYAEQDARRFFELVTEIGGIEKERAYLVLGGTDQDVRRAVDEAKGRIHELSRLGPTALIIYVSAHADETHLHLEGTSLSIAELRKTVQQTPASLRLVIIDACRTGAAAAFKGGSPGPAVTVNLHRSEELQGDLFIRSTSSGEPAQEWSFLRGALFTHHFVTGLRGAADVDRNGRISLAESYSYAFHRTVASAITARAGPQHPSFDFRMKGFGDWTFTNPGKERSAVVLGASLEGTVWIVDRGGYVVAEVDKVKDGQVRLALRPGWYRVIIPEKRTARVTDVSLAWGKRRVVERHEMVTMRLREVVARGNKPVVLRPFQLSGRYYYSLGPVDGLVGIHKGALGFSFTFDCWVASLLVSAGAATFDTVRSSVTHIETDLQTRFGREIPFSRITLGFGLYAAVSRVWQRIEADDHEERSTYGFDLPSPRKAWLPSVGGFLGLGIPVTERLWLEIDGTIGPKWVFMKEQSVEVVFAAGAGAGGGVRF